MKTKNADLMRQAKKALTGKWKLAIVVCLLNVLITGFVGRVERMGGGLSLMIAGPMMYGMAVFSLAIARGKVASVELLFEGFRRFLVLLEVYLRMILSVMVWMLLLIVPGILKALSYSQVFYILADDKEIGPKEALVKSQEMMEGNRWRLVCLMFRFTGWFVLSAMSFGIGFLWLMPYFQVSLAKFYEEVKG